MHKAGMQTRLGNENVGRFNVPMHDSSLSCNGNRVWLSDPKKDHLSVKHDQHMIEKNYRRACHGGRLVFVGRTSVRWVSNFIENTQKSRVVLIFWP